MEEKKEGHLPETGEGAVSGAQTRGIANIAQVFFVIQGPGEPLKIRTYHSSVLKYVLFLLWAVFLGKHVCPARKRYLYGFSALI